MAFEIAKVATAEDEAQWIQSAGQCTVSRFRDLVKALREQPDSSDTDPAAEEEPEAHCLLTVTANREDTWLYECAKMVFRHVEGGTTSDLVEAIVAEATTTMMELLPKDSADPNDLAPSYDAQNAWNRQLAKYREEAERLCDSRALKQKDDGIEEEPPEDIYDFSSSPEAIDRTLRQISGAFAERDLAIGELAEQLWNADVWRRLGYATDRQYARERLGMALSSVKDRRQLARRLCRLPHLKGVFQDGHIGYEAARLVAAVATPANDAEWAARAKRRTLVHLREDIRAAELLSSVKRRRNIEPPSVELVMEVRALETAVVTGAVFAEAAGTGQKSGETQSDVAALWAAFAEARRAPSSQSPSLGRDTLRLRVQPDIRALYRGVERG
jgi:hypothetical protein